MKCACNMAEKQKCNKAEKERLGLSAVGYILCLFFHWLDAKCFVLCSWLDFDRRRWLDSGGCVCCFLSDGRNSCFHYGCADEKGGKRVT